MPFANYTDLRASVAGWLNRRDLDAQIPDFIALAEKDMWETLRDRLMQRTVTANSDCGEIELPSDYLEMVSVRLGNAPKPLRYIPWSEVDFDTRLQVDPATGEYWGGAGQPTRFYTLKAHTLTLSPAPSDPLTQVTMIYYAQPTTLTEDTPTNWLLEKKPGLYLYGSLLQAAQYLVEDERVPLWQTRYNDLIAKANLSSAVTLHSGGVLVRGRRGFG